MPRKQKDAVAPASEEEVEPNEPATTGPQLSNDDPDNLRILLSTDNHLGYAERDPVRGMDSFAAFEEVLYLAKKSHCDIVVLAGDLFHENRPTRRTLHKTMEIMRRYCMSDDPVKIQILSDQGKNFQNISGVVNYQDPNYSVGLPIFSIHGNHDDPSRECGELLAALDLLTVSNLVNYWGRQEQVDQVEISPVLIQKGSTKVALYGLGNMRDERLSRMWQSKKVSFFRPESSDQDGGEQTDDFFNIFCLHQNRDLGRGPKNCIQESMIPEWMDLVVWGHEHECRIDLNESVVGTFRVTQPGSSVATSLVPGEAARKKVAFVDIVGRNFRLTPVPLTQVRSFVTTEISLREHKADLDPEDPRVDTKVTAVLEEEVHHLIRIAREKREELLEDARLAGNDASDGENSILYHLENPEKVLVRIKVEHSGFSSVNNQRFGAKFVGEIANPEDSLLFFRSKHNKIPVASTKKGKNPIAPEDLERINIEDLVRDHLEAPDRRLQLLNEKGLSTALEEFVEKSATASITDAASDMLQKRQKKLITRMSDEPFDETLVREMVKREAEDQEEADMDEKPKRAKKSATAKDSGAANSRGKRKSRADMEDEDEGDSDEDEDPSPVTSSKNTAKSVRQAAQPDSQRKVSRRRKLADLDDDDDLNEPPQPVKEKARPSRVRSARGSAKKRVNYDYDDDDDDDLHDGDSDPAMDEDDDDDVLVVGTGRAKTKTPASTSRKRKPAPAPSRSKKSTTTSRKTTRKKAVDDSDDEVAYQGASIDLDDDWGTANTKSNF